MFKTRKDIEVFAGKTAQFLQFVEEYKVHYEQEDTQFYTETLPISAGVQLSRHSPDPDTTVKALGNFIFPTLNNIENEKQKKAALNLSKVLLQRFRMLITPEGKFVDPAMFVGTQKASKFEQVAEEYYDILSEAGVIDKIYDRLTQGSDPSIELFGVAKALQAILSASIELLIPSEAHRKGIFIAMMVTMITQGTRTDRPQEIEDAIKNITGV